MRSLIPVVVMATIPTAALAGNGPDLQTFGLAALSLLVVVVALMLKR